MVIILTLLECMLFLLPLFNFFNKHRGKYAKLDFVKFISLEIIYFVGTSFIFIFKKYRHDSLSYNKSKLPFALFSSPLFLYFSLFLCLAWQLLLDFESLAEIKPSIFFELNAISHILHISFLILSLSLSLSYTLSYSFSLTFSYTLSFPVCLSVSLSYSLYLTLMMLSISLE